MQRITGRSAGFFLIAQFVLMWITFFVLSSSIDWPASLDDPASIALPRLLDHYGAVMTGYSLYLLVALLLVPATAALNGRFGLTGALGQTALALAIISAMAKAIGITRWLFAMPALAQAYANGPIEPRLSFYLQHSTPMPEGLARFWGSL